MGPAAVQGQLCGTAPHAWARVVEPLVRVCWLHSGEPCGWLAWLKHEFDAPDLISRSPLIGPAR
jgi:hypothetical protein